ncbi:MAG: helix-turn-helix transcriptional regulator [Bacteroidales bacterium]|nr:helix-turn-helix transcriptional regulator [Bacteroidales bacterium]
MNNICVHIGAVIKQKVEEKGITMSDFADAICCSRTNVYNLFKSRSIDTEKLAKISSVLDYDFFSEYKQNDNMKNMDEIEYYFKLRLCGNALKLVEVISIKECQ